MLINGVDTTFKEIAFELAGELDFEIQEIEVIPDHVHLLIDCNPQFGIYKVVKRVKGGTSNMLRDEFPWLKSRIPSLWTNSACILTTGGATVEIVRKYIQEQKNV